MCAGGAPRACCAMVSAAGTCTGTGACMGAGAGAGAGTGVGAEAMAPDEWLEAGGPCESDEARRRPDDPNDAESGDAPDTDADEGAPWGRAGTCACSTEQAEGAGQGVPSAGSTSSVTAAEVTLGTDAPVLAVEVVMAAVAASRGTNRSISLRRMALKAGDMMDGTTMPLGGGGDETVEGDAAGALAAWGTSEAAAGAEVWWSGAAGAAGAAARWVGDADRRSGGRGGREGLLAAPRAWQGLPPSSLERATSAAAWLLRSSRSWHVSSCKRGDGEEDRRGDEGAME